MNEIKHTPKPWSRNIKPARKYPIVFAGRNTHVAQVLSSGLSDEEVEANINLITASPDLLEAAENALESLKRLSDVDCAYRITNIQQLQAAIAKAKGTQKR